MLSEMKTQVTLLAIWEFWVILEDELYITKGYEIDTLPPLWVVIIKAIEIYDIYYILTSCNINCQELTSQLDIWSTLKHLGAPWSRKPRFGTCSHSTYLCNCSYVVHTVTARNIWPMTVYTEVKCSSSGPPVGVLGTTPPTNFHTCSR